MQAVLLMHSDDLIDLKFKGKEAEVWSNFESSLQSKLTTAMTGTISMTDSALRAQLQYYAKLLGQRSQVFKSIQKSLPESEPKSFSRCSTTKEFLTSSSEVCTQLLQLSKRCPSRAQQFTPILPAFEELSQFLQPPNTAEMLEHNIAKGSQILEVVEQFVDEGKLMPPRGIP